MNIGVGKTLKAMLVAFALLAWGMNSAATALQPQDVESDTGTIAGGPVSTCALTSSGGVKCWGFNSHGQLGNGSYAPTTMATTVANLVGAVAIAGNWYHFCALLGNGGIKCWGYGLQGQLGMGNASPIVNRNTPQDVATITNATAVVAGDSHSCALLADTTVKCWGANYDGQLGIGSGLGISSTPLTVPGLVNVVAIAAGWTHTCAVLATGDARCWGSNGYGQLGAGNTSPSATPIAVSGLTDAVAITAGSDHTCARLAMGTIQCWGRNYFGQLGNGANADTTTPVSVSGISGATAVVAGGVHTCALMPGATLSCWGSNSFGHIGDGTMINRNTPTPVDLANVVALGTGYETTCARLGDGALRCWGNNRSGQLGSGIVGQYSTAVTVVGISGATALAVEGQHSCAVVADGAIKCWGDNGTGQLGDGSTTERLTPVDVNGISGAIAVETGLYHSCALLGSGQVKCWGDNSYGELGNGSYNPSLTPVTVSAITNAVALSLSHVSSCALLQTGAVRCWGSNYSGELGSGAAAGTSNLPVGVTVIGSASAIASGGGHFCAVQQLDGAVHCWGRNSEGQIGDGSTTQRHTPVAVPGLTGVARMALGYYHSCALRPSGTVQCWGANQYGQLGNGSFTASTSPVAVIGITNASRLSAGVGHTCAEVPGALQCWGLNDAGQLGDGTIYSRNTPVTASSIGSISRMEAGFAHTCAIVDNGEVRCWGLNGRGQLGNGLRGYESLPQAVLGSPFITYNLSYSAGANGSISGPQQQVVDSGANGSVVTAVPASGYDFTQWSDGTTVNPRSDSNVQTHITVTAAFTNAAPTISGTSVTPASPFERESAMIGVTATDASPGALTYSFDCDGNGSFEVGPQAASSTSCLFQTPGTYSVGVRVADVPGASSTSSQEVIVRNSIPVVTLNPDTQPLEDSTIALNATATSPSSGEQVTLVEADCDYDGNAFDTDLSATSTSGLSCAAFPAPGTHIIALRASDDENEVSSIVTATVSVVGVNDAPSLSVGSLVDHPLGSSGAQSIIDFATFDAGPADEDLSQSVQDYVIDGIDDPAGVIVASTLDIANDGRLSYTLSSIGGIATVQVHVLDNGGTANGGGNASPVQQFSISVPPSADLQVSKDNQRSALIDGETTVYAIVIANAGPNPVAGATLTDTLPATLANGSWMCVSAQSSATCPTPNAGSGDLNAVVNLGVNQFLRFDVMAEVDGSVGAFVTNSASAALPMGITELNTGNDSATDQDPIVSLGIFANGFEAVATPPTVPGATGATQDR